MPPKSAKSEDWPHFLPTINTDDRSFPDVLISAFPSRRSCSEGGSEFQYLSFSSPRSSSLKVYILLAKRIKNDTVWRWTALCPQSSFERKRGESRCANGYMDYRGMRGE